MTVHPRLLSGVNSPPPHQQQNRSRNVTPPVTNGINSDFVIILISFFCALICALGLVAVARCAWLRRFAAGRHPSLPPDKGLKKKVLKSLPRLTYGDDPEQAKDLTECPICLAEFAAGEEVRLLPECGHGFHVRCIDPWLGSHSSCPSCRQLLGVARCQKCGRLPGEACLAEAGTIQPEPRENPVSMSSTQSS